MDSTDEEFYGSTSFTVKGRRTKRQRTTTAATSSHGGGLVDTSYGSSSASATPTPTTTDDHDVMSDVTSEEVDMANCLILLAQGRVNKRRPRNNININKTNITADNNGVYECKTCNRTFPSFQALGGHRTSHKKAVRPPPQPTHPVTVLPPCDGGIHDSSPPSENTSKNNRIRNSGKTRLHECTMCGSEFPSGQALGGHMRRHRPIVAVHDDRPIAEMASTVVIDSGGPRNILSLDLNLPAPNDDDNDEDDDSSHMVETKFHVLPTPALVDCHY